GRPAERRDLVRRPTGERADTGADLRVRVTPAAQPARGRGHDRNATPGVPVARTARSGGRVPVPRPGRGGRRPGPRRPAGGGGATVTPGPGAVARPGTQRYAEPGPADQ